MHQNKCRCYNPTTSFPENSTTLHHFPKVVYLLAKYIYILIYCVCVNARFSLYTLCTNAINARNFQALNSICIHLYCLCCFIIETFHFVMFVYFYAINRTNKYQKKKCWPCVHAKRIPLVYFPFNLSKHYVAKRSETSNTFLFSF